MKNVALYVRNTNFGGAEKRFIRIYFELRNNYQKKINIYLFVNKTLYKLISKNDEFRNLIKEKKLQDNIKIIPDFRTNNIMGRIIGRTLGKIYAIYYVNKIIRKYNIDIIHSVLDAIEHSFFKNKKAILCYELASEGYSNQIFNKQKNKIFYKNFDFFKANSPSVYKKAIKLNKNSNFINENRIFISELPFFKTPEINYDLEKKDNIITFVGRLVEGKNPILFSEVIKKFLEINTEWKIFIVGRGKLQEKVEEILKEEIVNGYVFVEHKSNPYEVLYKSKIFVSIQSLDNFPSQSLMEAMYMKNAILASNEGDTKKLVRNECNGYLVNLSEEEILKKLLYMTENTNSVKIKKMGDNSRKIMETAYSSEKYIKELLVFYDELIKNRKEYN